MDRRDFLTARKRNVVNPSVFKAADSFRTNSGINPYAGPWTRNEVTHLLKRTMFGAKKADVDYFLTRTMSQAVDELLNLTAPMPSPPVNDYSPGTADPNVPAGQTWVNNPTGDGTLNSLRRASFKKWWTGLLLNQERTVREKMTLFWANHFGTETVEINTSHYVYQHHNLLRQNALGNLKQLVKAVTIDPGMLRYLNGYLNTAAAPDENYARELQELFTIGKNEVTNMGPYTESDVKQAARILTGWRINNATYASYFDPARHDTGNKQFSAFYNNMVINGRTGANGALETDDLLNMIFAKNEVAEFIVRKLYRWFIYYTTDTATETNVIQPLAAIFRSSNYDLKPVLTVMLKSEHFFDVLNQGCQIKSPVDQIVGCMREFGVTFPDPVALYADAYGMWNYLYSWAFSMNQNLGDPPDVSGWPSYYQTPAFYQLWINSDTLPKRNRFTDTMITNGYTRNGRRIIIDAVGFTQTLPNPGDPNALIDDALAIMYRIGLSAATRQKIKEQILLTNQTQDFYWTNAWSAYIANPSNQTNYNVVNTRLKALYQYFMNLPEYQLA
jgi:uncharacterized protein (DUF1800 family)